jgi:hypothetical protein
MIDNILPALLAEKGNAYAGSPAYFFVCFFCFLGASGGGKSAISRKHTPNPSSTVR